MLSQSLICGIIVTGRIDIWVFTWSTVLFIFRAKDSKDDEDGKIRSVGY